MTDLEINRKELFTEKDMVSFGAYLLSKERLQGLVGDTSLPELTDRMMSGSHADFENWKSKHRKGEPS